MLSTSQELALPVHGEGRTFNPKRGVRLAALVDEEPGKAILAASRGNVTQELLEHAVVAAPPGNPSGTMIFEQFGHRIVLKIAAVRAEGIGIPRVRHQNEISALPPVVAK